MKPANALPAALAAAALLLAACEPPSAPPPATTIQAARDATPKPFRERRGWVVEHLPATADAPAVCRAHRSGSAVSPQLIFISGESESAFRLVQTAQPVAPGAKITLAAQTDDGQRVTYTARALADNMLEVSFPTERYDDTLLPLARAQSVVLKVERGPTLTLPLAGSSWAINATDECRRMHLKP